MDKSSKWNDIGRILGVSLNDRENIRRDNSLSYKDRLERVIDIWLTSGSRSWDDFISAMNNLQYADIVDTLTNGGPGNAKEQALTCTLSNEQSIKSNQKSMTIESVKPSANWHHARAHSVSSGLPFQYNPQAASDTGHKVSKVKSTVPPNPIHLHDQHQKDTVGSQSSKDTTIYDILLRYKPQLVGMIRDPSMLANELAVKGLLSPDTQDCLSKTTGRFKITNIIIDEILKYFEQHVNDCETFEKFCQVLKDHGQPGLDELAKEMEQTLHD